MVTRPPSACSERVSIAPRCSIIPVNIKFRISLRWRNRVYGQPEIAAHIFSCDKRLANRPRWLHLDRIARREDLEAAQVQGQAYAQTERQYHRRISERRRALVYAPGQRKA